MINAINGFRMISYNHSCLPAKIKRFTSFFNHCNGTVLLPEPFPKTTLIFPKKFQVMVNLVLNNSFAYFTGFQEKISPKKNPPDPKLNLIPNLTLMLPLTPHGGTFFRGELFLTPFTDVREIAYGSVIAFVRLIIVFKYMCHIYTF